MTKSRGLRAPRLYWTPDQIELLREHYPDKLTADLIDLIGRDLHSIYAKASELGIKKSAAFLASPAAGRTNGRQGIGTRFEKGHQTWNAGTHYVAGGRSAETRFKKGSRPVNWMPIGSERLSKEGYLQRKMTNTGITRRDYVPVHHIVWIEHNGPIPQGHRIIFKDSNKQNIVIENLDCISLADNMRRNSLHNYPKPIAQLIQLRGAINRKINRRLKDEQPATTDK